MVLVASDVPARRSRVRAALKGLSCAGVALQFVLPEAVGRAAEMPRKAVN